MRDAAYWISRLKLRAHPEGGWYRQTYRADLMIAQSALPSQFKGARAASTAIYFLLDGKNFSAFHRLAADELWHFYAGGALTIHVISPGGDTSEILLGPKSDTGESFQGVVPAGSWLGARVNDPRSYSLVGCTMAPGFDFADFELADRAKLIGLFPQHRALIEQLTRA